jgi:hypothetical protein
MGWSNYVINKDRTIALEVKVFDNEDLSSGVLRNTEELIEYLNNDVEDRKIEVINYLWDRTYVDNAIELMINIFIEWYKKEDWEIVNEQELKKYKDVRIISR